MEPLRRERLANGLVLEFRDLSNRYFGDYHRLHIEVSCRIALDGSFPALSGLPEQSLQEARRLFGSHVEFRRELTRMGVSGADLEQARSRMIDGFMATTGPYLGGEQFPAHFVQRQTEEARKKRRFTPGIS